MSQVSWRAADELVQRVRQAAAQRGESMNEFITRVLDVATDPDLAGDENERLRERLRRGGLLWEPEAGVARPDPAAVAAAARRAGAAGPHAADLVAEERGPR
ncbi:hypothetical protein GCM10027445_58960 [Amycolatopsis endophytica]|uniref:Uncharacterized protein n=1 Tax=Amycolatopsis endophytica TaxID=860233 RepID=A0A853AXW7_9PSEU|nr:transcriptional regulator [Amycolatopsis endophytica]NYI87479.1 hypothetical protein [Amycolatopsis endophytica]